MQKTVAIDAARRAGHVALALPAASSELSGRVKPGHTALVVTRLCRGCEPVGVHIPLNTASSACVLLDSGGVPRVPGSPLEEELDAIMQESVAAVKSAKPNMSSSEKRAWWKARILLDERLGGLISKMDAAVRPWRFLFSGSSGGPCCLSRMKRICLTCVWPSWARIPK